MSRMHHWTSCSWVQLGQHYRSTMSLDLVMRMVSKTMLLSSASRLNHNQVWRRMHPRLLLFKAHLWPFMLTSDSKVFEMQFQSLVRVSFTRSVLLLTLQWIPSLQCSLEWTLIRLTIEMLRHQLKLISFSGTVLPCLTMLKPMCGTHGPMIPIQTVWSMRVKLRLYLWLNQMTYLQQLVSIRLLWIRLKHLTVKLCKDGCLLQTVPAT